MAAFATLGAVGDLTGNWSWTVWLLIPLLVLLGIVTALLMGPFGEPPPSQRGTRGVSHYLERHAMGDEDE